MSKLANVGLLFAALIWVVSGCQPAEPVKPAGLPTHEHGHEHAHAEHGPHDGHLIELGSGKYHAEMVHDDASGLVTIYLLGEDAKTAAPIAEESLIINAVVDGKPQSFTLAAKPLEGEPEGQTSRFELADPALLAATDDPKSKARFNVTIAGSPFVGEIEAHDHK